MLLLDYGIGVWLCSDPEVLLDIAYRGAELIGGREK